MSVSPWLELIKEPESATLEVMASVRAMTHVAEVVTSLLNAEGGTILIGIDTHGELVGVPHAADDATELQRVLLDTVVPTPSISVSVENVQGKDIIVVQIPIGTEQPYVSSGRIMVRRGSVTAEATRDEVSELIQRRHALPTRWESQVASGVRYEDLDGTEIASTASIAINQRLYPLEPNVDGRVILEELNLAHGPTIRNSGLILFGNRPQQLYPQTRVRVGTLKSESRSEFVDHRILQGHAFQLLREIESYLRQHIDVGSELPTKTLERHDRPAYPWAALREGVINALVHRDYAAYDSGLSVAIYPDHVCIWNSGSLPHGMSISDLKRGHVSRPHNPDIAHVFFLRGLVEQWGIGAPRMIDECQKFGLPEPEWDQRGGGITLTLRLPQPRPERRLRGVPDVPAFRREHLTERDRDRLRDALDKQAHDSLIQIRHVAVMMDVSIATARSYKRQGLLRVEKIQPDSFLLGETRERVGRFEQLRREGLTVAQAVRQVREEFE